MKPGRREVAAVVAMRWVADGNARPGAHLAKFCRGQPLRRPVIVHADLVRCLSVALLAHSPRGAMHLQFVGTDRGQHVSWWVGRIQLYLQAPFQLGNKMLEAFSRYAHELPLVLNVPFLRLLRQ